MIERPLSPEAPLIDAVRAIEQSPRRIAVVVDANGCLIGTLTDGDVRRFLLANGGLDAKVSKAMYNDPIFALVGSADGHLKDLMREGNILSIPIVDKDGKFNRLIHLRDLEPEALRESGKVGFSFAVIMAGGEGIRLRPLTVNIPKPMVRVGGTTILERQILRLAKVGVERAYLSVNYLAHVIEDHFRDGGDFGIKISYLREQKKLGTAGALSLLPEHPEKPFLVMNGDILTNSDLNSLYLFHISQKAMITVAAIDHRVHIPYGVIRTNGLNVTALVEKPSERFLCNAGIYVLSPSVMDLLPKERFFNMTDLIEECLSRSFPVSVFPVFEYWNDIGTPEDLERARVDFDSREEL